MSSNVLPEMLINRITTLPKSKSTFAPFKLYLRTLAKYVSPNNHVVHQTPKSKLNGPMVHFPYIDHHLHLLVPHEPLSMRDPQDAPQGREKI